MGIVDPLGLLPRAERVAEQAAVRLAGRVTNELLDSGAVDRVVLAALEDPRVSELAGHVLDSAGMDRLVGQVLESRLFDASIARVLATDELWVAVEEIAQSPVVTDAIGHQGLGFADQVAGELGERSRQADARLERMARRLMHRPPPPGAAPSPGAP